MSVTVKTGLVHFYFKCLTRAKTKRFVVLVLDLVNDAVEVFLDHDPVFVVMHQLQH